MLMHIFLRSLKAPDYYSVLFGLRFQHGMLTKKGAAKHLAMPSKTHCGVLMVLYL